MYMLGLADTGMGKIAGVREMAERLRSGPLGVLHLPCSECYRTLWRVAQRAQWLVPGWLTLRCG